MYEKFHIFEPRFNDEELENEFNNFFHKYNLTALLQMNIGLDQYQLLM